MPQVPNRYFNNQVLQDVGRNLSLAIAGSPEADAARLAQKHTQMQMDRQAQADTIDAKQRADAEAANQLIAEAMAIDPKDISGRQLKFSEAIRRGANPASSRLLGMADPGYEADVGKIATRTDAQIKTVTDKLAASEEKWRAYLEEQGRHNRAGEANTAEGIRSRAMTARENRDLKKSLAELKSPGGKPLTVSSVMHRKLSNDLLATAGTYGGTLDPVDHENLSLLADVYLQDTRNAGTAKAMAWDEMYGDDPQMEEGESSLLGFGESGPGKLIPRKRLTRAEILARLDGAGQQSASRPSAASAMPTGNLSDSFMGVPGGTGMFLQPIEQAPQQFGPRAAPAVAPVAAPPTPAPPAAVQMLQASPTPQLKAAFMSKYGYLPPGL